MQHFELHVRFLAHSAAEQLQRTRVHLAGLFVRPHSSIHCSFADECSVVDRLLDQSHLVVGKRLAGNEVDVLEERFALLLRGEVLSVVHQVV